MSGLQSPVRVRSLPALGAGAVQTLGALLVGVLLWALLFKPEIKAAIETWQISTAYGHCFLVLPMTLFLVWDRRNTVLATPVRPRFIFAGLAVPVAAAWLVAERLGIMEGRQLVAVAALEVLLLAVLGWRMFRVLAGPLLYLFFLVPFGMFLTPSLQHFTARFTVIGLDLLGIPNFANDLIIEIPAGTFLVAEACAGLRFLIASVAFGVFYALLNYRSPIRRGTFILASIVVPIVANGLRALGIVVLGAALGSAEAATADHIIYGWIFFSIVMMLLVVAGLPLRESRLQDESRPAPRAMSRPGAVALGAAIVACLFAAIGPAAAWCFDTRAVPIPLASLPQIQTLAGCRWSGGSPQLPATRILRHLECPDLAFDIVIETFPARSTAAAMRAERLRLSGELAAEDTSFSLLPTNGDRGVWTLAQSYQPFRAVALAGWVDGRPANSGLLGRVQQARNSILGSDYMPVLISIAVSGAEAMRPDALRAAIEGLRALIQAQTGLTDQLAALTRR